MSDLVGNPEDRFSRVEAQIIQTEGQHVLWRYGDIQQVSMEKENMAHFVYETLCLQNMLKISCSQKYTDCTKIKQEFNVIKSVNYIG